MLNTNFGDGKVTNDELKVVLTLLGASMLVLTIYNTILSIKINHHKIKHLNTNQNGENS